MMKAFKLLLAFLVLHCFHANANKTVFQKADTIKPVTQTSLVVLGTIQDAGSPQVGCTKNCCKALFMHPDKNRMVVSLGLVDPANKKTYLFEATPDLPQQLKLLKSFSAFNNKETPDGILVTHAHIGHYTGLMYLGKEAMNADSIPVFVMPHMKNFIEQNGPWSQLVKNKNIVLQEMNDQKEIGLTNGLKVIPFTVPHRDEFSETVGYTIIGPNKKVLFIPDIDKWQKWNTNIIEAIAEVDYAFIDGTFYDAAEINNRDITTIPHPFMIESMKLFKDLPTSEKKKIYFIHFNHTNPVINKNSEQYRLVIQNGFNIATINDVMKL
jgi:pyrroloquinoline quinone biosynthesis protein B